MAGDDEGRPVTKPKHAIGDVLDTLSVDELRLRIDLLREEVARLEGAIFAKMASRSAADAVFKR